MAEKILSNRKSDFRNEFGMQQKSSRAFEARAKTDHKPKASCDGETIPRLGGWRTVLPSLTCTLYFGHALLLLDDSVLLMAGLGGRASAAND